MRVSFKMEIINIDNSKFKTVALTGYTFALVEENLIKKTIKIQQIPLVFGLPLTSLITTKIQQPSNEAIVLRRSYE
jgi:hypothetical protein